MGEVVGTVDVETSLRALEIEDDGLETAEQGAFPESDTDDEYDEYDVKIVWEGGTHGRKGTIDGPLIREKDEEILGDVISFKDKGNMHYAENEYRQALVMYTKAIQLCMEKRKGSLEGDGSSFCGILSVLYSNISATAYKMNKYPSAIEAARRAAEFSPKWTKPLHRMAEAYLRNENYAAAVGACRKGEALCQLSSDGLSEFSGLYDKIVVLAAASGHDYVYSGRRLEVREAGKDAWLGKPAPHVPELDGPLDESTALASDDLSCVANGQSNEFRSSSEAITNELDGGKAREDALVSWDYSKSSLSAQSQRTSFRCIQEAYNAARDGDRIVLLKGTHNGLGETLSIKKRILIEGEGMLGDTVIDQRANVPMFKIERGGVVIRNIDLDHTGFRESILIQGPKTCMPLIERCIIKCSGDDCIHIAGHSSPFIRYCQIQAKTCGVRCFESPCPKIERCIVEKCGKQGISIMDDANLLAWHLNVCNCGEDGIVAMGSSKASVLDCLIKDNKGPGVDCSDESNVRVERCQITNNIGGCWAWDSASVSIENCIASGGSSHVFLVDGDAKFEVNSSRICGTIHACDKVWQDGLLSGKNEFQDPPKPTDFPIESGAFKFEPSLYVRR